MKKVHVLLAATMFAWTSQWIHGQTVNTREVLTLNSGWEFSQAGKGAWKRAEVPGCVHADLLRHYLIPNPFYGMNEDSVQWVENEDWEYRTTFVLTPAQLEHDAAKLIFEGLDTYADVFLNGSLILKSDNMFVGHEVAVKEVLRSGVNRLQIYFHSPIKHTLPQYETNGFNYPAGNDHHEKRLSVFSRKAPYSYGWDWGLRLVTAGIWRPICLHFYDVAFVDDVWVVQESLTDEQAVIRTDLEITNVLQHSTSVNVELEVRLDGKLQVENKKTIELQPGNNKVTELCNIDKPQRWMPNGWGTPTLYDLVVRLRTQKGEVVAERMERIGLRTLRVVTEKDEHGESFYFEVNGRPLFAKGANYIPQDAMLPSVTEERYQELFRSVKEANMNMIRVWGGGIYEDDYFYRLADENGILIWQDFMFACTPYPADPAFLKRVESEARYNIRRLRNRASLAMWCGNNEILEALKYWGFQKEYSQEDYNRMWDAYDSLFKKLLPDMVNLLDSGRFYMHSSPYFANWGRPESWGIRDSHNWGVWYGKKPFESSDHEIPRFMSEFGFQSFPEMKTIASFAEEKDYAIESPVMNAHQKSSIGNSLIRTYMERDYIVPSTFEDFVYVGSVLQGKGIRHGLEAHRRNRPYCMGTLYWQLNDSWPVVSWSSIDYFGNWKALHYQAKRAFAPILINPYQQGDSLQIHLCSDLLDEKRNVSLEWEIVDFNGKRVNKPKVKRGICLHANRSWCEEVLALNDLLDEEKYGETYLSIVLKDSKGEVLAHRTHFFLPPRLLKLPSPSISYHARSSNGRCELVLKSNQLAKDVFVEVPWQGARYSDNYFDLLPGETKKIIIYSSHIKDGDSHSFRIKHLRQTYP